MNRKALVVIGLLGSVVLVFAVYRLAFFQSAKDKIMGLLKGNERLFVKGETEKLANRDLLQKYFDIYGYDATWTTQTGQKVNYPTMLKSMLNYADTLGLDPADYHADFLAKYDSLSKRADFDVEAFKEETELVFSDAAMSFLFHVAYGKEIKTEFNGVKYNIDSARVIKAYDNLLSNGNWRTVLNGLEPRISQYANLKYRLNDMKAYLRDFPEMDTIKVADTEGGRIAASIKMRFYGAISDSLANDSTGMLGFRTAVKELQAMFSLDTTGTLDKKTLTVLNEPLGGRVEQVKQSLNYWRWTGRIAEREFILVNLPAARLQIVNPDSAGDLSMRVIVGKPDTKTPSFTAYISKVIAYPYWNVPFSIATKEMLPKIKKNVGYLDANNLQVLNGKGDIVDPNTINWSALSTSKFPYRIRQSTGCDNALGVLKFDLNSPFSIYLHDTNRRDLFGKKDRFMSHGCVRVEKPMELANYLLSNGLDSVTMSKLNQCLKDEKPTTFKLKKDFPVLILYMMADIDPNGNLRFYRDVYDIEEEMAV